MVSIVSMSSHTETSSSSLVYLSEQYVRVIYFKFRVLYTSLHLRLNAESLHVVGCCGCCCSCRPVNELSCDARVNGCCCVEDLDNTESLSRLWLLRLLLVFSGWFSFIESVESPPVIAVEKIKR